MSDPWVSCEGMVVILLNNLFSQLWVRWNIEECFPVDQVVFLVPRGVLKFQSFDDEFFGVELVFCHH